MYVNMRACARCIGGLNVCLKILIETKSARSAAWYSAVCLVWSSSPTNSTKNMSNINSWLVRGWKPFCCGMSWSITLLTFRDEIWVYFRMSRETNLVIKNTLPHWIQLFLRFSNGNIALILCLFFFKDSSRYWLIKTGNHH